MCKRSVCILLALLLFLSGCSAKAMRAEPIPYGTDGGKLVCAAETEEEAQQIGELYGIELVKFFRGVAVFYTEEDLNAVIQRGIDQGWPELTIDHVATTA